MKEKWKSCCPFGKKSALFSRETELLPGGLVRSGLQDIRNNKLESNCDERCVSVRCSELTRLQTRQSHGGATNMPPRISQVRSTYSFAKHRHAVLMCFLSEAL